MCLVFLSKFKFKFLKERLAIKIEELKTEKNSFRKEIVKDLHLLETSFVSTFNFHKILYKNLSHN
jgi:hypothetical protein